MTDLSTPARATLMARLSRVKLLVLDFDGIFTDGKVTVYQDGTESVVCDRRDGLGIAMLKIIGVKIWVITREKNPVVMHRCLKLGIPYSANIEKKDREIEYIINEHELLPNEVAYMGDDLNDLPAFPLVGIRLTVARAHPEVIEIAHYVTPQEGGNGAIRHICELILEAQGHDVTNIALTHF